MHDPVRRAAQQETIEPLPSMRADHDEVVATSHFAHGRDGITRADIGRYREVRTGQRLGRVVHNLFGIPLPYLRPAFESPHHMRIEQLQRGDDREDGDRDGVLEGVRRQPRVQTDCILAAFHRQEDTGDGASFPFTIKVGTVAWSRMRCETLPASTSVTRL